MANTFFRFILAENQQSARSIEREMEFGCYPLYRLLKQLDSTPLFPMDDSERCLFTL